MRFSLLFIVVHCFLMGLCIDGSCWSGGAVGLVGPGPGAPCIGYRTISFLVKIQSPFLCSEMAQLDHLGHFMQQLKNKMGIFLFQV